MDTALNRIAPEGKSLYIHALEGPDDMPAHIKCNLIGISHSIPIKDGKLNMGKW